MYVQNLASQVGSKPPAFRTALVVLSLLPLYISSYLYRIHNPYGGHASTKPDRHALPPADFIRDWLDTHVVSPVNLSPLATYCNRTEWHPNLVFNLANANGGIGNIRGNFLDFLFYAVEAGASIILPGMAARDEDNISDVWAARAPFESMFDEEWFFKVMGEACPQMSIYKPVKGQQMAEPLPGNCLPRSRRMDVSQENTRKAYLEHLDQWLKGNEQFKPDNLTLVNLERTLWEVDTRSLPQGLRRTFGQLLRIKPTVRRLAAVVVQQLTAKYAFVKIDPKAVVPKAAFYGAHLRTEVDAQNAGWLNEPNTNFSAQTDAYMAQALKHKLSVVYVASGNATDFGRFRVKAATNNPPLLVTSKLDLLAGADLEALQALTWDEQALVDYEVLQRCSVFGGFVKSSFSYNIAMTRNQWIEDQSTVSDPWFVMHEEEGVAFDDGISRILARDGWHEQRIPRGMWP